MSNGRFILLRLRGGFARIGAVLFGLSFQENGEHQLNNHEHSDFAGDLALSAERIKICLQTADFISYRGFIEARYAGNNGPFTIGLNNTIAFFDALGSPGSGYNKLRDANFMWRPIKSLVPLSERYGTDSTPVQEKRIMSLKILLSVFVTIFQAFSWGGRWVSSYHWRYICPAGELAGPLPGCAVRYLC